MTGHVVIPIDVAEKLMDVAGRAQGITDTPTLMMFAKVRRLIEEVRREFNPPPARPRTGRTAARGG